MRMRRRFRSPPAADREGLVVRWLLDSDPSIRWQVLRDVMEEGRWRRETLYPGTMPVKWEEREGRPSRWNTLRALRVLDWYRASTTPR
jgi:hypothetical protein